MNIILLGAPGSGKGTLAEQLVQNLGFIQMSTGDLMRKAIADKTQLGNECVKYMNEGKLVPDEITNGIVEEYLQKQADKLIFDGYPRTENQAKKLDEMLSNLDANITLAIYLDLPDEVLMNRIAGRLICPICKRSYHKQNRVPKVKWKCDFDNTDLITRPDDSADKVAIRLDEYNTQTAPLIDYYVNKGIVKKIEAAKLNANEMFDAVKEYINA